MKPRLEEIRRYVEEEIVPYSPMIVSKLCITDTSPKKKTRDNLQEELLFKPININRYQSVKKMQEVFYKPAYRIKDIKTNIKHD
jgi:hypothetical protein